MATDKRKVYAPKTWNPPGPAPHEHLAYISHDEMDQIDTGEPGPTYQVAAGQAVSGEGIGSMAQSDIQPNNQLVRFRGNARGMGWDVPSYAADRGGGTGAAGATSGPPGNSNPGRSGGGSSSGGGASGGGSGAGVNRQQNVTARPAAPRQPGVMSNTKRAEVGYGSGGGMPGPGGSFDRAGAYGHGSNAPRGPQSGGQPMRRSERFNYKYPVPQMYNMMRVPPAQWNRFGLTPPTLYEGNARRPLGRPFDERHLPGPELDWGDPIMNPMVKQGPMYGPNRNNPVRPDRGIDPTDPIAPGGDRGGTFGPYRTPTTRL